MNTKLAELDEEMKEVDNYAREARGGSSRKTGGGSDDESGSASGSDDESESGKLFA